MLTVTRCYRPGSPEARDSWSTRGPCVEQEEIFEDQQGVVRQTSRARSTSAEPLRERSPGTEPTGRAAGTGTRCTSAEPRAEGRVSGSVSIQDLLGGMVVVSAMKLPGARCTSAQPRIWKSAYPSSRSPSRRCGSLPPGSLPGNGTPDPLHPERPRSVFMRRTSIEAESPGAQVHCAPLNRESLVDPDAALQILRVWDTTSNPGP